MLQLFDTDAAEWFRMQEAWSGWCWAYAIFQRCRQPTQINANRRNKN